MRSLIPAAVGVALAAALVAGCASTPPEADPVQIKLNDLDARVTRMEHIIQNQSLVELAQHVEATQGDVRELRGRLEELEHENADLRKQQHDLYNDLDKRIRANTAAASAGAAGAVGGAGATGSSPAGSAAGAPGTAGEAGGGTAGGAAGTAAPSSVEQAVYNQSFDALKAGSYSTAITGFKSFLETYPQSPLAENAEYWLGETYYVNHNYDSAAEAFRTVLKKWPDSRKAPDALLKLGFTQYEQKQLAAARATLTEVTRKYPGTDAAKLASERLQRVPAQ